MKIQRRSHALIIIIQGDHRWWRFDALMLMDRRWNSAGVTWTTESIYGRWGQWWWGGWNVHYSTLTLTSSVRMHWCRAAEVPNQLTTPFIDHWKPYILTRQTLSRKTLVDLQWKPPWASRLLSANRLLVWRECLFIDFLFIGRQHIERGRRCRAPLDVTFADGLLLISRYLLLKLTQFTAHYWTLESFGYVNTDAVPAQRKVEWVEVFGIAT